MWKDTLCCEVYVPHKAVGIQMKLEFFQRKFWTASRQTINCYLIDNNGFILVSEDYQQTGYFFGEVEGAVMNKLLTMGSFKRITLYDYQAMCRTNKESSDSAHSLLDPYNAFFAAVKWIMTELVLFLVEFNLCSWWHSDLTAKAQRLKQTLEPCDTEYPAFVSERTIKETTGNIACDDCFKSFVIQQIPSSNLFMVVVDNECFCDSIPPITMAPIEISLGDENIESSGRESSGILHLCFNQELEIRKLKFRYLVCTYVLICEVILRVKETGRKQSACILSTPDGTSHHQKNLHSDGCVCMVQTRASPKAPGACRTQLNLAREVGLREDSNDVLPISQEIPASLYSSDKKHSCDENICCRVFLAVEDEIHAPHKAVEELLWISMGSPFDSKRQFFEYN
ncbi:hypothetical protein DUI87_23363 [Hirundo rustica rustica]|uniref:Voltage-dependent calcium channel alpha-2/delta subunit conserved region domain-containing protein n=1 Tax=Hirundo rustica rustica TaxID=333673 RepID=A0A3M0JGT0_HIRRU|nr:hypothetical protein DUI87_23363 [Hirundo rustica rustica]